MKYIRNNKNKKGFTLVELIVVMSIIGILVLLAAPSFIGKTEEANRTKHFANVRVLEDAAERYFIDHGKWPRGEEEPYTPEEVTDYAERIFDITGEEVVLEEGHYWNIDYEALRPYAKLPSEDDQANYVLRNPVGKIYYLDGLTDEGASRTTKMLTPEPVPEPAPEPAIPDYYAVATDSDFTKVLSTTAPNKAYYWRYTGSQEYVILPETINGEAVTDYYGMFDKLSSLTVKGVASENLSVTNMSYMFYLSPSKSLDVSHLDTSNVTNMRYMFSDSQATTLDLSSFNTSNVTNMNSMFRYSRATALDLSSFDTWNVTDVAYIFDMAAARTGYARNATDAAKLNGSYYRPSGLIFIVKEQPVQYELATDADFVGTENGSFRYNGISQYVIIPDTIKDVTVTSYKAMFQISGVRGVVSTNPNVTDMSNMFAGSYAATLDVSRLNTSKVTTTAGMFLSSNATALDLSSFDTTNVTSMASMFSNSKATVLDVSTFNTSKVTNMLDMFERSQATALDVSSFDTSNVTTMYGMFQSSQATTLDLSSFDTGKVTNVAYMFDKAVARTGYARNTTDALKLNGSSYRPFGLTFIVKSP